jgi:hypothetical protein
VAPDLAIRWKCAVGQFGFLLEANVLLNERMPHWGRALASSPYRKVNMRGRSPEWLLERRPAADLISLYRPADFDGKVLHLHYAREQEIEQYLYMVVAQGRCTCSFG